MALFTSQVVTSDKVVILDFLQLDTLMQTHPLHTGFDFLTHIHSSSLLPGCFKESPESNNNHIAIYTKCPSNGEGKEQVLNPLT